MSAVGNDALIAPQARLLRPPQSGLTLIELMVVLMLIAIVVGAVSLSLRGNPEEALDREAHRVASVLEAARAQARASGVTVRWIPAPTGFAIVSSDSRSSKVLISNERLTSWIDPNLNVRVESEPTQRQFVTFNSEPLMSPVLVTLSLGERRLRVATDGLRPFRVESGTP